MKKNNEIEYFDMKISESKILNIYAIFHIIIAMYAVAVSIKCEEEFKLVQVLLAIICPHFYLIFAIATKGLGVCFINNDD